MTSFSSSAYTEMFIYSPLLSPLEHGAYHILPPYHPCVGHVAHVHPSRQVDLRSQCCWCCDFTTMWVPLDAAGLIKFKLCGSHHRLPGELAGVDNDHPASHPTVANSIILKDTQTWQSSVWGGLHVAWNNNNWWGFLLLTEIKSVVIWPDC